MNKNWSKKIPQEIGLYFFIGDPFVFHEHIERGDILESNLYVCRVRKTSNGFSYIFDGNFGENKIGLWKKIDLESFDIPDGVNWRI